MESTPRPVAGEPRATILIADDEPAIRALIADVLGALGYRCLAAATGDEAWEAVGRQRPDLVLLDIKMPGRSGIEVCRQMRADPGTRRIPVIMVTGLEARRALEESIIAGADDFLGKPIDALELSVRVRSLLRVRRIEDEGQRLEAYVRNLQALRAPATE
jgi:CheY-like chemotaxis protein